MKRISEVSAIALFIIVPALLMSAPTSASPPLDKWTVMVYIDADNNLEPFGLMNLQQMESVGSSDEVNFVVLFDTYSGGTALLYVKKGESKELADWGEANMADPATMTAFIKAAKKAAPAQNYAFISWDHGGGWRGMNWDDSSVDANGRTEYTDMKELRKAIVDAGLVFDVFAFDQCLMAQPEVAYQLMGYAEYVVFSEETIYGQGFPYEMIATDLVANPDMGAKELSKMMVRDFGDYYSSITWANDWTISAFDMSYMDDLTDAAADLARESLEALSEYKTQLKNDRTNAQSYYYPYFIDLKGYVMNVVADKGISDVSLKTAAEDVKDAIDAGIVMTYNSKHNSHSYGLSIYFPAYRSSYLGLKAAYENVPFATDTGWLYFLEAFASNK
ncbi:MAG: clostripain-related cysteine peptidase [Thermoplasmata archaeon]